VKTVPSIYNATVILDSQNEPAPTSAPSTGCPLMDEPSTQMDEPQPQLTSSFTLVTHFIRSRFYVQLRQVEKYVTTREVDGFTVYT
jgi:hypothetical protein